MKPYRQFKPFQIRWKEPMGRPCCPYLYRWTFLFFNFSIRIHHWLRSDDTRFFHNHASNFISLILKGHYTNVTPFGKIECKAGKFWKSNAYNRHYLEIPKEGAWTLLFCGRPFNRWGFFTDKIEFGHRCEQFMRPLRYFHKYGVHPCICGKNMEHQAYN